MSPPPIRVLVCDDQRVVREGLAMLVGLADGIEVVGSAADGAEAVKLTAELRPDVVLMDLRMPGTDGVAATTAIRAAGGPPVLILTTYSDEGSLLPALTAGARGYLTKDASAEEIEAAIRAVHQGRTSLDPKVQERLIAVVANPKDAFDGLVSQSPANQSGAEPLAAGPAAGPGPGSGSGSGRVWPDGLTAREAEVLALIAAGLSNHEIGARLYLGRATVKTHVNRIFAKTGVRDRAQAVRYAFAVGLAEPPPRT